MKIWCDVCDKEEASVFCSADEAALCVACDRRVHHANKLASKHPRFNLVSPSYKESPLCDICQERRALLFCQEDRAILCRECDIPIHKASEYTKKHNRFLLTGVKLTASASATFNTTYNPSPSSSTCCDTTKTTTTSIDDQKKISPSSHSNSIFSSNSTPRDNHISDTSSISEYLMETLPGWRVDDFLDPSSYATSTNVLCKICDQDLERKMVYFSLLEDLAIWVPLFSSQNGLLKGFEESTEEARRLRVPQIRGQSVKKNRHVWLKLISNVRLIC